MIRRTFAKLAISAALFAVAFAALAFRHPEHEELPNLDKRRPDEAVSPATAAKVELSRDLAKRVKGLKVHIDPILGVPRLVGSTESYLTGPKGVGRGVAAANAAHFGANDPHRAVKAFIREHSALFGHGVEALDRARVDRDSVAAHSGLRTVVWQQELEGIPVFDGRFVSHTTAKGELVNVASQFVPNLDGAAALSLPNRAALLSAPPLSAAQAIQLAGRNVGESAESATLASRGPSEGAAKRQRFSGGNLIGESEARLTYFPLTPGKLRLAWDTTVTRRSGGEMFRVLIDVETGEVLLRHCLTAYLTDATYNVFTSDSPSPLSPGHATPMTIQPPLVSRTLVTLPALNTNASPNGWIDDAINETRGNNVDAHLDLNNDNQPDLPRPQGSPFRIFDFPMDFALPPTETNNQKAAVVQLFYLCNWYHDKLYDLGFTEAAGNFQGTNFGRGGIGNDAVQADAQDGGGFNNANFGTPSDGSPGRMQMYLFDGPNPDRDGDLDAEIVIHEFTHGLSNRRVGNGTLISALQTSGMGEGWSDFYAMALLAEPGDALDGNFAAGSYATFLFFGLNQNYYYGIRRYPYSTNLSKNPLTFKDIDGAQASAHAGIPRSPIIGNTAAEVHNQGEVWCVALWEVRANLVVKHGFAIGNQLALQLVTDGMGLTPANPNFLEARDGILQADQILNSGANRDEIWTGFAKRGMGFSATSPASSTTTGVVEAFDMPDDLRITPGAGLIASGPVGGLFTPDEKRHTLFNLGSNALAWTVSSTTNWLDLTFYGGTLAPAQSLTNTATINSNANALAAGFYTNILTFSNSVSGRAQSRTFILAIGQPDNYTELFDASDFDLPNTSVTFTPDGSTNFYSVCRQFTAAFPTDPASGISFGLSDDSFAQITFSGGAQVWLYGSSRNSIFVGSNGYLTYNSGDVEWSESFTSHFAIPRVSGFYVDLDLPSSPGGSVSWKQLADRVAVTWQNVRRWGTANANNFQIEMFFDGRIRLTWLACANQNALVGLSRGGGLPTGYTESDVSLSAECPVPLLVSLPVSVIEGAGVLANAGAVSIPTPRSTNVVVSLASGDTGAVTVPPSVTIFAGQTSNRFDLTIGNDVFVQDPRIVNVTATAAQFLPDSANLTVIDDEARVLQVALTAMAYETDGMLTGQGRVLLSGAPLSNLVVTLDSSDGLRLVVPASVVVPAGQTSAFFHPILVDNATLEGPTFVEVSASAPSWASGSSSILILDDETPSVELDRFEVSTFASVQYENKPFNIGLTALTAGGSADTSFSSTALLRCLRATPDTNAIVRVLAFVTFADLGGTYPNTVAAISSHFENFTVTPTFTTDAAQLRAALADKEVLLVPEQGDAGSPTVNEVAQVLAPVVREFVARGGILVACSYGLEGFEFITGTGLITASRTDTDVSVVLTSALAHPISAGVSSNFSANFIAHYTAPNGVAVIRRASDNAPVVLARDFGLGRAVLIGTDFYTNGSGLDRVLANAVRSAQYSLQTTVAFTPHLASNFTGGLWADVVTVGESASNVVLFVSDALGHIGVSAPFSVRTNTPPSVTNLMLSVFQDSSSPLMLTAFDADPQVLSFTITANPANGLLTPPLATNGQFTYTPAHAFFGVDVLQFTVSDGFVTNGPALALVNVLALPDSDGDGIPNNWESLWNLNGLVNDANLDPDGDGFANFQEYLANTDPNNSSSALLAPLVERMANGFWRLTWRSVGGVRYRVQYCDGDADGNFNGIFTDIIRPAASEIDSASMGVTSASSFTDDFTHAGGAPVHGNRYYRVNIIR